MKGEHRNAKHEWTPEITLVGTTNSSSAFHLGGLDTRASIALVVVLILVLGIGVFAGWAFGTSSSPSSSTPGIGSQSTTAQDTAQINTAQEFRNRGHTAGLPGQSASNSKGDARYAQAAVGWET